MVAIARAVADTVNQGASVEESDTAWPPKMLAITRMNPMIEHSSTLPGRQYRKYTPISSAIGMVAAIVKVPHGLPFNAFTTTSATTATSTIMMSTTVSSAVNPPTVP